MIGYPKSMKIPLKTGFWCQNSVKVLKMAKNTPPLYLPLYVKIFYLLIYYFIFIFDTFKEKIKKIIIKPQVNGGVFLGVKNLGSNLKNDIWPKNDTKSRFSRIFRKINGNRAIFDIFGGWYDVTN